MKSKWPHAPIFGTKYQKGKSHSKKAVNFVAKRSVPEVRPSSYTS